MDAGRMGVVQDPQGAWFLVWEPKQHIGAGLVNAHGALSWNELGSPDPDGSAKFYGDLFGWETSPMEGSETPYLVIRTADGQYATAASGRRRRPGRRRSGSSISRPMTSTRRWPRSPSWAATCSSARPTSESPKIAVAQDPQGAVFALYSGHLDD